MSIDKSRDIRKGDIVHGQVDFTSMAFFGYSLIICKVRFVQSEVTQENSPYRAWISVIRSELCVFQQ